MQKFKLLDDSLCNFLEKFNISVEDILAFCAMDMDLDCNFSYYRLVLLKNKLIIISSPTILPSVTFNGYVGDIQKLPNDAAITEYDINLINHFELIPLVSGAILTMQIDGSIKQICATTNKNMADLRKFIRIFDTVKRGEVLSDDDYSDKNKRARCPKCGTPYTEPDREFCSKCMDRRSVFFRLLSFFKPYRLKIIFMFAIIIGQSALSLITPYLSGKVLYGKILTDTNIDSSGASSQVLLSLLLVVLAMFVLKLLGEFFGAIHNIIIARIVPFVVRNIKSKIFDSMNRLSIKFYQSRETGTLMTRVLSDADQVTDLFIDGLPALLIDIFTITSVVAVMIALNWRLAIAALLLLPLSTLFTKLFGAKMWTLHGMRHRASRAINSQVNDNLTGARVIRAFGQQASEERRFKKYNTAVRDNEMKLAVIENKMFALFSFLRECVSFVVWILGAFFILREVSLDYATLITFVSYVGMLSGPIDDFSRMFRQWVNCMNSAQRIFEIIDANPDVVESSEPKRLGKMSGNIELRNVSFAYDKGHSVLKNISLSAKSGELLGVVGRSGAGKSTLLNLITRLYDPDEGDIFIDGVNLKDLSLDDLRGNVAMVSQETYIFMGTVAENISYAKPDATADEIVNAAIAASAHDFICKLPDGYDTLIGASGRELSGGERQRISIARAILCNPSILILDEATASVDTQTEQAIGRSLEMLVKNRTTISVAHRLSTLKNAKNLVVIENGEIVERGTHSELLKKKGIYYHLAHMQSKALAMKGVGTEWTDEEHIKANLPPRGPMGPGGPGGPR